MLFVCLFFFYQYEYFSLSLQPSFHGREVTCMCYVGRVPGTTSVAIATGSEDTNINLMSCILPSCLSFYHFDIEVLLALFSVMPRML